MLSARCGAGTHGFHSGDDEGGSATVPGKDENAGGAADLQATGRGGGIPQLLDQGEARHTQIPTTGLGQGDNRGAVGSVDLRRAAVGAPELEAEAGGGTERPVKKNQAPEGQRVKARVRALAAQNRRLFRADSDSKRNASPRTGTLLHKVLRSFRNQEFDSFTPSKCRGWEFLHFVEFCRVAYKKKGKPTKLPGPCTGKTLLSLAVSGS